MHEFDIEERKKELNQILDNIEKDITELKHRIEEARVDILYVTTYEEAKRFDETHDLEEGLEHIRLF